MDIGVLDQVRREPDEARGRLRFKLLTGDLPFTGFHANEVVFLPLFKDANAFPHQRIEHNRMRLTLDFLGSFESLDDRSNIVAIDALRIPPKGLPFGMNRLDVKHLSRGTIGLLIVAIDKREKIIKSMMRG